MLVKVDTFTSDSANDVCQVPKHVMKQLELSEHVVYKIGIGQRMLEVLVISGGDSRVMRFSKSAFVKLLLIRGAQLNVTRTADAIFLGPVVGVFLSEYALKKIALGTPKISVRELVRANEEGHCLLYFFSIQKTGWRKDKVRGYVFHPKYKKWKLLWMPLPNVVYDRGVGFEPKRVAMADEILDTLRKEPNIQFINDLEAFSKWSTYRALSRHPQMQQYLPETIRYRSFSDIEKMCEKYTLVFLKSYWGSCGKEVMAIERKGLTYDYTVYKGEFQINTVDGLPNLQEAVEEFIGDKRCIVQQGIRLFRIAGCPFDIRVQLNKNRQGEWEAITNQARVSREKSLITNYALGADLMFYKEIHAKFKSVLPTDDEVSQAATTIASFLEKEFGQMGEIGIDLAIDENGHIKVIEANAKPDKNPVPGFDDKTYIAPQFLRVLEYAQYLAEKNAGL